MNVRIAKKVMSHPERYALHMVERARRMIARRDAAATAPPKPAPAPDPAPAPEPAAAPEPADEGEPEADES